MRAGQQTIITMLNEQETSKASHFSGDLAIGVLIIINTLGSLESDVTFGYNSIYVFIIIKHIYCLLNTKGTSRWVGQVTHKSLIIEAYRTLRDKLPFSEVHRL